MEVVEVWGCEIGDGEVDASSSALRYVCGSGIELTRAHNLLVYEGQNEYVHVDILAM